MNRAFELSPTNFEKLVALKDRKVLIAPLTLRMVRGARLSLGRDEVVKVIMSIIDEADNPFDNDPVCVSIINRRLGWQEEQRTLPTTLGTEDQSDQKSGKGPISIS
ncbi:MAG: hypothetical protein LQ340_007584 [Diploschistes diacapsis]|nr:MAG: hypothetical protein LQ340_007584 [Diploschistes diacapsis]